MPDGQKEREDAHQRTSPTGSVVDQAIFTEGKHEMERTTSALAWSGLAAGPSMGFSIAGGKTRSEDI